MKILNVRLYTEKQSEKNHDPPYAWPSVSNMCSQQVCECPFFSTGITSSPWDPEKPGVSQKAGEVEGDHKQNSNFGL